MLVVSDRGGSSAFGSSGGSGSGKRRRRRRRRTERGGRVKKTMRGEWLQKVPALFALFAAFFFGPNSIGGKTPMSSAG